MDKFVELYGYLWNYVVNMYITHVWLCESCYILVQFSSQDI